MKKFTAIVFLCQSNENENDERAQQTGTLCLENVQLYSHASVGLVPVRSAQVVATLSDLSLPHFPRNRLWRFREKWGSMAGDVLVAVTCIPVRDKRRKISQLKRA